jgi:hypothetical protein
MEGATLLGSVFSHTLYISDNQASSTSFRVPQQLLRAAVGYRSGFGIPTARLDADFLTIQTSWLRKRNRVNRVDWTRLAADDLPVAVSHFVMWRLWRKQGAGRQYRWALHMRTDSSPDQCKKEMQKNEWEGDLPDRRAEARAARSRMIMISPCRSDDWLFRLKRILDQSSTWIDEHHEHF